MDENTKEALDGLFDRAARSKTQADDQARKAQEVREQFLAQYTALERDVIRPALEDYVPYLAGRGVSAEIRTDSKWGGGQGTANIALFYYGDQRPTQGKEEYPVLRFYPEPVKQVVSLHTSTMGPNRSSGSGGHRGSFAINDVTPALIRTVVFDWLKDLIR